MSDPVRRYTIEEMEAALAAQAPPDLTPLASSATHNGRQRVIALGALEPVVNGCDFVRWCRDHQAEVSEPLWYAVLSNLARCEGGREAAHTFSREYPGYSARETDDKLDHALAGSAPITCARIQELGFGGCPAGGHGVTSPAALGLARVNVNGKTPTTGPAPARASRRTAVIVNAATIPPETMTWLWEGRLGEGALTNAVGLPDQGKTLMFCDLTARLTTGSPMPPDPKRPGLRPPHRVLILTLEDALSQTIVPRLIQAKADLALVDFVRMVQNADGEMSLLTLADDLDALAGAFAATPYALVVVDGISGYLGEAKTHNDADVRRVLAPFTALLDRAKVAGFSVMHPPKSIANLAYYAGGSVAFTALPRVALGVAPDPEDESLNPRRLVLKIKGNLYGPVPSLAYRIIADSPAGVPWLEWEPQPVTVNIADVLDPVRETAEDRSIRHDCEDWLHVCLADGPRPTADVEAAASKAGFKPRTLRRARDKVTDSVKVTFSGPWMVKLR